MQDRGVGRIGFGRAEGGHELAVIVEQFRQGDPKKGGGQQFAFGFFAFDLFLDPLSRAGADGLQRVVDLPTGHVILNPPDPFLAPLKDGCHG